MRETIDSILLRSSFRSNGERKIAQFLDRYKITFNYEPSVLVRSGGYDRIWYPDFGLPKYSMFIEYFGMENNHAYNEGTKNKLSVYGDNEIDVIPVFPKHLRSDYGKYILDEIYKRSSSRLYDIEQRVISYHKSNKPLFYSRK